MADLAKLILIGAGNRGARAYGAYALQHPERARFVAVAEPDPLRRARFGEAHSIPEVLRFSSWETILDAHPDAYAVVIASEERFHVAPALWAMKLGYDVLHEKPMAATPADCVRLARASERLGRILEVCHVLRHAPL